MAMKLEQVVPFGRSLEEYQAMFDLSPNDLSKRILGVGDGPASFNAEMTELGHAVLSVDPLYAFTGQEIERRFYEVVDGIMEQVQGTPDDWVWTYHHSPHDLRHNRVTALQTFLADYDRGKGQGRYLIGALPELSPSVASDFDLALCSHLLFLYSAQFDAQFHEAALLNMLRVAAEVRVFPLLTLRGKRSEYVEPIMRRLQRDGYAVGIQQVDYELQRGGNEMLWIRNEAQ
ncbi:MAG: SAM-dependent methyltransferase [Nitrospirales bacterium]|nr:MAG: SAM-dependent methyltransferase [Nitrospirales bacterium]